MGLQKPMARSEKLHQQEKEKLLAEAKDYQAELVNIKDNYENASKSAIENKIQLLAQEKENETLKRQNAKFQETLTSLETDIKNIDDKLGRKEERIAQLERERDQSKQKAEDAKRAKEVAEDGQQELEIQLSNFQGDLTEKTNLLQRTQKELLESKQLLRAVKNRIGNEGFSTLVTETVKPLDGYVTATSPSVNIVMISIGSDDGVAVGHKFTVYRGDKYVGKVVVEKVFKDAAAARISSEMTVTSVLKGDKVSTRLSRGS
jgi:hypothetical protein